VTERHYLFPRFDIDWEDVDDALAEVGAIELEADEDCQRDWSIGENHETLVHLYLDRGLNLEKLVVEGEDRDRVARHLRERVRTYAVGDLPQVFADDGIDVDDKLAILAAVAPRTAEPELVDRFRWGFDHDDPLVREQAVLVATVPAWPELRSFIERLAQDDDDPEVRESAKAALLDFEAAG
jgi:hypothetical protein